MPKPQQGMHTLQAIRLKRMKGRVLAALLLRISAQAQQGMHVQGPQDLGEHQAASIDCDLEARAAKCTFERLL